MIITPLYSSRSPVVNATSKDTSNDGNHVVDALQPTVRQLETFQIGTATKKHRINVKSPSFIPDDNILQQTEELSKQPCTVNWSRVVDIQLANWATSGISTAQVATLCNRKAMLISIHNSQVRHMTWNLSAQHLHRVVCSMWLIQMAINLANLRNDPIPNLEIALQPGDGSFSTSMTQWDKAGPLLSNVKCNQDASVSFPQTLHDQFGMGDGRMSINMYQHRYQLLYITGNGTWLGKDAHCFFSAGAGATTRGNRSHLFNTDSPYMKTVDHAVPISEYGQYRYLVYAYGHCGWSRRLHELAFMRAGILMEKSACREYVHHIFDPVNEYISVEEDFSDVRSWLQKLAANEEQSRRMAEQWHLRGTASFTLQCTLSYVDQLLRRYAALQRFTPVERTAWPIYTLGDTHTHFKRFGRNGTSEDCPAAVVDRTLPRSHEC